MGKGGGSAKMQVVDYRMSIHMGISAGPLDAITKIRIGEKVAWTGEQAGEGTIVINRPELFGGEQKEGGVSGIAYYLPGGASQTLPAGFAARLGLTPSTAPGYRNMSTIWFAGEVGSAGGNGFWAPDDLAYAGIVGGTVNRLVEQASHYGGFLWSKNSPFIRPTWITGRRAPKGLNPAISMIGPDANPAHIIYEVLTSTDFGLAAPSSTVDGAGTFAAVAQQLYDENFGLSLWWSRQGTVKAFIQEILDHIQAVLYIDPASGKWTIKLLRDDYVLDNVATFDMSNAKLLSFQRKAWGEIVNEIVVTWTNPETEKEETVTVQNLAAIEAQGDVSSDSRNYYAVRNRALATELAFRDLRQSSTPLAAVSLEVHRGDWSIPPGSVVRLNWPQHEIDGVVLRVMSVTRSSKRAFVRINLLEDIFSLTRPALPVSPGTDWEDPSIDPPELSVTKIFTLPYAMSARLGMAGVEDGFLFPEAIAGVLFHHESADVTGVDLYGEVTLPDGELRYERIGTRQLAGYSVLTTAFVAEASTVYADTPGVTTGRTPVEGGFALIGSGNDAATEIALVKANPAGGWILQRGAFDTVPREWPVGTQIWFMDSAESAADQSRVRGAGETARYKPLARSSRGTLDLTSVSPVSATVSDRPHRPARPANVQVNGQAFGAVDISATSTISVTWSRRNRLTEDAAPLAWTAGDVQFESGQVTAIRLVATNGSVIRTWQELPGTSFTFNKSELGGASGAYIEVLSTRDGLGSLQNWGTWLLDGLAEPASPPTLPDVDDVAPVLQGQIEEPQPRGENVCSDPFFQDVGFWNFSGSAWYSVSRAGSSLPEQMNAPKAAVISSQWFSGATAQIVSSDLVVGLLAAGEDLWFSANAVNDSAGTVALRLIFVLSETNAQVGSTVELSWAAGQSGKKDVRVAQPAGADACYFQLVSSGGAAWSGNAGISNVRLIEYSSPSSDLLQGFDAAYFEGLAAAADAAADAAQADVDAIAAELSAAAQAFDPQAADIAQAAASVRSELNEAAANLSPGSTDIAQAAASVRSELDEAAANLSPGSVDIAEAASVVRADVEDARRRAARLTAEVLASLALVTSGQAAAADENLLRATEIVQLGVRADNISATATQALDATIDLEASKASAASVTALELLVGTDDGQGSLFSRAGALEALTASLEIDKAEVSRVLDLEALVGTSDGGGALIGRVGAVETATADLETGKVDVTTFNLAEARITDVEAAADTNADAITVAVASVEALDQATAERDRVEAQSRRRLLAELAGVAAEAVQGVSVVNDGLRVEAKRVFDLSVRAGSAEARLSTNEQAIVDLEAGKAEASALQAVSAQLALAEGDIDALQSEFLSGGRVPTLEANVTTLESAVVDLETGKADASALQTVSAALAVAEGDIAALEGEFAPGGRVALAEADVTSLQSAVVDLENNKVEASDFNAVEARVTVVEGETSTNADAITTVSASVETLDRATAEADRAQARRLSRTLAEIAAGQAEAVQGVSAVADGLKIEAKRVFDLGVRAGSAEARLGTAESALVDLENNKAETSALNTATSRITANEDAVALLEAEFAPGGSVPVLQADVSTLETTKADASALTAEAGRIDTLTALIGTSDGEGALFGRVGTAETAIASLETGKVDASTFNLVEARVTAVEGEAAANEQAITDTVASVTALDAATAERDRAQARRLSRTLAEIAAGSAQATQGVSAIADDLRVEAKRVFELGVRAGSAEARLGTAESALVDLENNKAEATSVTSLEARMTTAESDIGSLEGEFTGGGRVTLAEARLTTAEGAIVDLEAGKAEVSRVTTLEATVGASDGQGALVGRVGTAESAIADLETGKVAVSTFNLLEARVSTTEGELDTAQGAISANTASITTLDEATAEADRAQARRLSRALAEILAGSAQVVQGVTAVADGLRFEATRVSGLQVRAGDAEARLDTAETAIVDLENGKAEASALTALTARVTTAENDIGALEGEFTGGGRVTTAEANITTLENVTADLELNKAEASRVTILEAQIGTSDGGGTLFSRVGTAEGAIVDLENGKASAQSVTDLTARVDDNEANVTTNAGAIATLEGAAAIYEVVVAASGSNPAVVRLKAGVGGSTVALAADEIRTAGRIMSFGADIASPRHFLDSVENARYATNPAGTVRTVEEDWDTGGLVLRTPDNDLLFDSLNGGVQRAGIKAGAVMTRLRAFDDTQPVIVNTPYTTGQSNRNKSQCRTYDATAELQGMIEPGDEVLIDFDFVVSCEKDSVEWYIYHTVIEHKVGTSWVQLASLNGDMCSIASNGQVPNITKSDDQIDRPYAVSTRLIVPDSYTPGASKQVRARIVPGYAGYADTDNVLKWVNDTKYLNCFVKNRQMKIGITKPGASVIFTDFDLSAGTGGDSTDPSTYPLPPGWNIVSP